MICIHKYKTFFRKIYNIVTTWCKYIMEKYDWGRLSFKTQLKIQFLLPCRGSRKVLENIPDSINCVYNIINIWFCRFCKFYHARSAGSPCDLVGWSIENDFKDVSSMENFNYYAWIWKNGTQFLLVLKNDAGNLPNIIS